MAPTLKCAIVGAVVVLVLLWAMYDKDALKGVVSTQRSSDEKDTVYRYHSRRLQPLLFAHSLG